MRRRRSILGREYPDESEFNDNYTWEDYCAYDRIDEERIATHSRFDDMDQMWMEGDHGQPAIEIKGTDPRTWRAGSRGGLNFGGSYLSRYGNSFTRHEFSEYDENGEPIHVVGAHDRGVLKVLDRLKNRLKSPVQPSIKAEKGFIKITIGSNRPVELSLRDEIFAAMFAQDLTEWRCRGMQAAFYTELMAPHLDDLQSKHPVEWVKGRAEYMIGYINICCLSRDFPEQAVFDMLYQIAPLACNTAPSSHLKPRRFKRTKERKPWLDLCQTWDPAAAPAMMTFCLKCENFLDISWFERSNQPSRVREKFKNLRHLIENGLNIDQFIAFYTQLASSHGASQETLIFAFECLEDFYDGDDVNTGNPSWFRPRGGYDEDHFLTHRSGTTRSVAPWIAEDQDFDSIFEKGARATQFEANGFTLAFDEIGQEVVAKIFKKSNSEALEVLAVFKQSGYKFHSIAGLSLDESLDITHQIAILYGIGNADRASRVVDLALAVLSTGDPKDRDKRLALFLAHAERKAPSSSFRSIMEGDDVSVEYPGLGFLQASIIGDHKDDGAQIEDNNFTPERFRSIDHFLALPALERSKLRPLIRHYYRQTPVLTTQGDNLLESKIAEDAEAAEPAITGILKLYEQARNERVSDNSLTWYLTFIAPKMPDPFSPPAGFMRLLADVNNISDNSYLNDMLFSHPDERAHFARKHAQKSIDKKTLFADLVYLWTAEVIDFQELERWFFWLSGRLDPADEQRIRDEVAADCDYLHPRHYEGLEGAALEAKTAEMTAHIGRDYRARQAHYDRMWEGEDYGGSGFWDNDGREIPEEELDHVEIPTPSVEARYQSSVDSIFRMRISNLHHKRDQLALKRLHFLQKVFPLLSLVSQNTRTGGLLGRVVTEIMDGVMGIGDEDPLESNIFEELTRVIDTLELDLDKNQSEAQAIPEYLIDTSLIRKYASKQDKAWEIVNIVGDIRRCYYRSLSYLEDFKENYFRGWNPARIHMDGLSPMEAIREELTQIWKPVCEAVPADVTDRLLQADFKMEPLFALADAVSKFKSRVFTQTEEEDDGYYHRRSGGYGRVTRDVLTLGSAAQGILALSQNSVNPAETVTSATVITPEDAGIPAFFRHDFTKDPDQMAAAFEASMPAFRQQVKRWRQLDFGLLPGGAKVHVINPFDASHIGMVRRIFDFDQTGFRLIHADESLILPPTPSSEESKHVLLLLQQLGIFKGEIYPELQITLPGRLESNELIGVLAASVILSSGKNFRYKEDAFGTNFDDDTASRMMTYDKDAPNVDLPFMFGLTGRTDIMGRFDPNDISSYRLMGSILMQFEHGVGPYQALAERFRKDFIEQVLKPHGLGFILNAPWIHKRDKPSTTAENKTHFEAVNACVERYFADTEAYEKEGELGRAIISAQKVARELAIRFGEARKKVWTDPKYADEKKKLFENL